MTLLKTALDEVTFQPYIRSTTCEITWVNSTERESMEVRQFRKTLIERARKHPLRFSPLLLLLTASAFAQATGGTDPWDNAVTVLKTAFTGTIATGLSLVAIVVGGLMFAYGEGQSKRTLAGIVFGVGMAVGAVNFMTWLFG
jgi:type IV secretory pathway VirB2 component (pilin)